ncbi:MAG: glycosyltransferase family 2 protein [Gemmatimonadaceae bacterium]
MTGIACVIPAYNAASTLANVARGLRAALPGVLLIAVDDGSSDPTHAVALASCDRVVRHPANRGKGAALRAGFAVALNEQVWAVATVDADGQHDPARAPELLDALACADMAIGARARTPGKMPLGRRITNRLASAAVGAIVGMRVPDAQSGYRAIRRVLLEKVHAQGDRYEFETEFLIAAARAGYRITSVNVPTVYGVPSHFRACGDSMRVIRALWRYRAPRGG